MSNTNEPESQDFDRQVLLNMSSDCKQILHQATEIPKEGEHVSYNVLPELKEVEIASIRNSDRLWQMYHETYMFVSVYFVGYHDSYRKGGAWKYDGKRYACGHNAMIFNGSGAAHIVTDLAGPLFLDALFIRPRSHLPSRCRPGIYRNPALQSVKHTRC